MTLKLQHRRWNKDAHRTDQIEMERHYVLNCCKPPEIPTEKGQRQNWELQFSTEQKSIDEHHSQCTCLSISGNCNRERDCVTADGDVIVGCWVFIVSPNKIRPSPQQSTLLIK